MSTAAGAVANNICLKARIVADRTIPANAGSTRPISITHSGAGPVRTVRYSFKAPDLGLAMVSFTQGLNDACGTRQAP
jgi:hypothetical protein